MELTHFSTFTGIAGFDLAAEWAGFRTVGQVEKNPYRQKVLRKYWSDVPLWEDIRDVTEESLKEAGIMADTQLNGRNESREGRRPRRLAREEKEEGKAGDKPTQAPQYSGQDAGRAKARAIIPITLVTGGFPCQSFSVAGKRRGKADDRYLWPEMFRIIKLLRPHWVLAENVTGIVRMALDTVLSDLESEGYSTQAFIIPACGTNAPHRRDRVWIVGSLSSIIQRRPEYQIVEGRQARVKARRSSPDVPDSQLAEVGDGRVVGRTPDEGGRTAQTGGETVCPREEAPQPSDPGQGGEALANPIDNRGRTPGRTDDRNRSQDNKGRKKRSEPRTSRCGKNAPDTNKQRFPNGKGSKDDARTPRFRTPSLPSWWDFEPDVGRVAHGIPHRMDRLAALGDAIVPQVAYRILKAIAEIERENGTSRA